MERFLQNAKIWCWLYKENARNYPGVNLTATTDGCDALLKAIELLEQEGPPSRRTILLKRLAPKDEAKVSGGQRYRNFSKLRLCLLERTADLQQMCISYDRDSATVEIVPQELYQLKEAIAAVRGGHGDSGIAPETTEGAFGPKDKASDILVFWPCFGHTRVSP